MRTTRTLAALAAAALLAVGAAACGDDDGGGDANGGTTREAATLRAELSPQSGSGLAGTAELVEEGATRTRVTVVLPEGDDGPARPAHVHEGTCDDLDPAPAYGLQNVEDGESETVIDVSIEELRAAPHAVNLHRSVDDLETYVACGDLR